MKVIKDAELHDLSVIRDLALEIWPDAYGKILSPDQLSYMLEKMNSVTSLEYQFKVLHHHFILVLEDDEPVGFASFSEKENDDSIYKLHKIYLLPQQQGKGTGKLLLNYVINFSKNKKASLLQLNVNRYNKAKYFYEKHGFKVVTEEDIDIGNGYFMNDYIMQLTL